MTKCKKETNSIEMFKQEAKIQNRGRENKYTTRKELTNKFYFFD